MTSDELKQIDKLLDKRFKVQDKKFKAIDESFKLQDKRFEDIDSNFKSIDKRFEDIDSNFKSIDKRFEDIEENIGKKIQASGEKIIDEIVTVMEETIFPKLETMAEKSDIERLERRIDFLAKEVGAHEVRLQDIESIPTIAHELKLKKQK